MIDEKDYITAFQLIGIAGDSKAIFMQAINKAKNYELDAAEALYKQGEDELLKAHGVQTEMIQQEAQGDQVPVNIILVHAQDHLTMAMMAKERARELIDLYYIIKDLTNN